MNDFLTSDENSQPPMVTTDDDNSFDFMGLADGIVALWSGITGTGAPASATDATAQAAAMAASASAQAAASKAALQKTLLISGAVVVSLVLIFFIYRAVRKKK